jgi:hypothetical protein
MAEIWGAVAIAGASIVGAGVSASASRRAGNAAARGADAATAESARQYDITRGDLAPWRVPGAGAMNQIGRLFGLPTTTSEQWQSQQPVLIGDTELPAGTNTRSIGNGWFEVWYGDQRIGTLRPGGANGRFLNDAGADISGLMRQSQQQAQASQTPTGPDMSAFFESPGYQFRRQEGTRSIERSAAARGGAFSGNALRALAEFNSGLASQEFGNYFNQLASIAGIGQTATNQTAAYGADHAANAGRNALAAGEARASGIIGQGNAIGQGVSDLAGAYGYFSANRRGAPAGYGGTGYGGSNPWHTPGFGAGVPQRYG